MQKSGAEPHSSPEFTFDDEMFFPPIQDLSLEDKTKSGCSMSAPPQPPERKYPKSKCIVKEIDLKRRYKKQGTPNPSSKKVIKKLEQTVQSLRDELDLLKRKMECCHTCQQHALRERETDRFAAYIPNYEDEMRKVAGGADQKRHSRGSMGSLEFENIDFHAPVIFSKEMDDKAWVYIGAMMIAMGSKCMDFDGTLNVFKILKESVDALRRQVDKSQPNISMDFYISQEDMQSEPNLISDEIGYDPFIQKLSNSEGLSLEGVKLESVEQFDLIYDSKLTFNLKYEAILGAMQYLRENSWITF